MISKLFSSIGQENAVREKDSLHAIFNTIDTDRTGSCSIEELTERIRLCLIESFFVSVTVDKHSLTNSINLSCASRSS